MQTTRHNRRATTRTLGARERRWTLACIVVAVALVGIGGIWLLQLQRNSPAAAMNVGGPFTLTASAGKQVTDRDFRGKFMLVYFGYTFCPDVCPTTLNDVSAAMAKLGDKAARVQPLFITVDPKRDTPEVIGQYASSFLR